MLEIATPLKFKVRDEANTDTVTEKTLSYQGFFGPLITFFNRCINTNAIIFFIMLLLYILYLLLKIFFEGLTLFIFDLLCSCCQKKQDAHAKKELAPVHFCWRVPRVQCLEESEVSNSKVGQKFQIDAQLSELRTKQYRKAHAALVKSPNRQHKHQMFVSLHSYDYRLNPDLIYLFRET